MISQYRFDQLQSESLGNASRFEELWLLSFCKKAQIIEDPVSI